VKVIVEYCLVAALIVLASCKTNESKLESAKALILEAEKKKLLTDSDCEKLGTELENIENDIKTNREKYSEEQLKEIGRLKGRFALLLINKGMKDIETSVKDLGNQMDGFLEGITDSTNNK
jgi:hypothetical protein